MTFDECIKFLSAEKVSAHIGKTSKTAVLQALVGTAYSFIRFWVDTPEEAMRWILWALFYFVQQEHVLTDKDEDVVLEALAAAKANAAFCKKDEEESK